MATDKTTATSPELNQPLRTEAEAGAIWNIERKLESAHLKLTNYVALLNYVATGASDDDGSSQALFALMEHAEGIDNELELLLREVISLRAHPAAQKGGAS
jgi:hypothetical protein